jgi:hypothetical protein
MRIRMIAASLALAAAALLSAPAVAQGIHFPNLVAAGDVDTDSVVLWTAVDRAGFVVFQVAGTPNFQGPCHLAFDIVAEPSRPAKLSGNAQSVNRSGRRSRFASDSTITISASFASRMWCTSYQSRLGVGVSMPKSRIRRPAR